MDLKNEIREVITKENLINKGDSVILGLSGGPDSACLFHILNELKDELEFNLCAVHVNHNLRGDESKKDEAYVKELCKKAKVESFNFSFDCNKEAEQMGKGSEEAGRILRYKAFDEVRQKLMAKGTNQGEVILAVAHNMDDQVETILFRIMRGTGIDGLAGMDLKGKGMFGLEIIRPLIHTSRKEIENYCKEQNLNPRIDKTNEEALYTRNKIRLELIPKLKDGFNANIGETLTRLGELAREDKEYLWQVASKEYHRIKLGDNELNLAKLRGLHPSIAHRIYELILKDIGIENIERVHMKAIDSIVKETKGNPSLAVDLPGGIKVMKNYDKLVFAKVSNSGEKHETKPTCLVRTIPREQYNPDSAGVHCALDADKISESDISIRRKQNGDFIKLKNLGRKKLQDFLVDSKVPKAYRDDIWVVAFGKEVLWIMPNVHFSQDNLKSKGRITGDYAVTDTTKSVLIIEKSN